MAHTHTVIDDDSRFIIDIDSRVISHPSEKQPVLVQHDHNSERFTFEIKRDIDGHDVTDCNLIRIHFINLSAVNEGEFSASIYEVPTDDLKADPDDDTLATFSWLVAQEATAYVGTLNFLVELACVNKDTHHVDYSWHSGVYEGVIISNGMDNSEYVIGDRYDVLDTWVAQFEKRLEASANQAVSKVDDALESAEDELRARAAVISADLTRDVLTMHGILTQTTGDSPDKVMSQKAVTDKINTANARIDQILTNRGVSNSAFSEDIVLSGEYPPPTGRDYIMYSLCYTLSISGVSVKLTITATDYSYAVKHMTSNGQDKISHPLGILPYYIKPTEEIRIDLGVVDCTVGQDGGYHKVYLIIKTDGTIEYYNEFIGGIGPESTTPLPIEINIMSPNEKQDYLNLPEITDARIDGNGNTHATVGDAIRSQFGAVSDEFKNTWDEMRWEQSQFVDIIDRNEKRIDNIEQILDPVPVTIDSETAYEKIVPADVLPSALIEKVGGMRYKSKNIVPTPYTFTSGTQNSGIKFTYDSEGVITLNGTSNDTQFEVAIARNLSLPAGKYAFRGFGALGSTCCFVLKSYKNGSFVANIGDGLEAGQTFTIDEETARTCLFNIVIYGYVGAAYTFTYHQVKPMLVYGGTIPSDYEPYFPGIRNAKVEALESTSKNLAYSSGWSTKNPRQMQPNESGLSNSYGTTISATSGDFISVTQTLNHTIPGSPDLYSFYYGYFLFLLNEHLEDGKKYRLSFDIKVKENPKNSTSLSAALLLNGSVPLWGQSEGDDLKVAEIGVTKRISVQFTYNRPTGVAYDDHFIEFRCKGMSFDIGNVMITEENVTDTTYVAPGVIDTFEIPSTVQTLDSYGLGVSADYHNHIEYTDDGRVKYVKMCNEVDLGTLTWNDTTSPLGCTYQAHIEDMALPTTVADRRVGFVCAKYSPAENVATDNMSDKGIIRHSNTFYCIRDSAYPDKESFKAAMSGVMLVYALATPITIDITDLITPDNYLRVQPGGRIVAVNEHELEAFTQIVYQKKEGA